MLKYDSRILFKYRYKKVIDENFITKKRNENDIDRKLTDEHISLMFRRIIDYLLEDKMNFILEGTYLFYSRQLNIGLIIEIKKDRPNGKCQIFIKTWLKDIEKRIPCDIKLHNESQYIKQQGTVNYFFSISDHYEFVEHGTTYLNVNDYEDSKIKIDMFCQQGMAWHITNIGLCELY